MRNDQIKKHFIESSKEWICGQYSASIRFIASSNGSDSYIWEALILLMPLPANVDNSFLVKTEKIFIGQIDINFAHKKELLDIVKKAVHGIIDTPDGRIALESNKNNTYDYYSETHHRDLWDYVLHLSIGASGTHASDYIETAELDNSLRLSSPPFDGIQDAARWLGLDENKIDNRNGTINIKISPPVDLLFDETSLDNDQFNLTLIANSKFRKKILNIALRSVPGDNLNTRLQVAQKIKWSKTKDNIVKGTASLKINNSDNILVMLMLGSTTIRRHWFSDTSKARNNRFLAASCFDNDLKMIKEAVLYSENSLRFENGVAALFFMLGFSPCVQIEKDSPDIILQTPNGRIVLVECTLRIADFSSKAGKLVDRRGKLTKELEKSGHSTPIATALVCRQPRDQIPAHTDELVSLGIILIPEEDLKIGFDRIRFPNEPDKMLDVAESKLRNNKQMTLGLEQ